MEIGSEAWNEWYEHQAEEQRFIKSCIAILAVPVLIVAAPLYVLWIWLCFDYTYIGAWGEWFEFLIKGMWEMAWEDQ